MGTQNLNNYNFNRIDAKLNYSSYYDFFLVSDEKEFNNEVIYSTKVIGDGDTSVLPVMIDLADTNSSNLPVTNCMAQYPIISGYSYYSPPFTILSKVYWLSAKTICDCSVGSNPNPVKKICDVKIGETAKSNGLYMDINILNLSLVPPQDCIEIYPTLPIVSTFNKLHFDKRFKMSQVKAYGLLDMPNYWTDTTILNAFDTSGYYQELRGGFYQGFYKLHQYDYEVLPTRPNKGWTFSTYLKINTIGPFCGGAEGCYNTSGYNFLSATTLCSNQIPGQQSLLMPTHLLNYSWKNFSQVVPGRTNNGGFFFFKGLREGKNSDVYSNALGFRITDDMRIGYRTLRFTGDCINYGNECDPNLGWDCGWGLEESYSDPICPFITLSGNCVPTWLQVDVVFERNLYLEDCDLLNLGGINDLISGPYSYSIDSLCDTFFPGMLNLDCSANTIYHWFSEKNFRMGTLKFYINGRIVHTVNDYEEIIPRHTNQSRKKQFGLPYNMSWGGGAWGYRENGKSTPQSKDLISKFFGGSFIGGISQMMYYIKPLTPDEIYHNFLINKNRYSLIDCEECKNCPGGCTDCLLPISGPPDNPPATAECTVHLFQYCNSSWEDTPTSQINYFDSIWAGSGLIPFVDPTLPTHIASSVTNFSLSCQQSTMINSDNFWKALGEPSVGDSIAAHYLTQTSNPPLFYNWACFTYMGTGNLGSTNNIQTMRLNNPIPMDNDAGGLTYFGMSSGGTSEENCCACTAFVGSGCSQYCASGCTSYNAVNFDPDATCDCAGVPGGFDYSCCDYVPVCLPGCTDITALNYDGDATCDCSGNMGPPIPDYNCCSYAPTACVSGCTEIGMPNYNPDATCDCAGVVGGNDYTCCGSPPMEYCCMGGVTGLQQCIQVLAGTCTAGGTGYYGGPYLTSSECLSSGCGGSTCLSGCIQTTSVGYNPNATCDCSGVVGGTDYSCCLSSCDVCAVNIVNGVWNPGQLNSSPFLWPGGAYDSTFDTYYENDTVLYNGCCYLCGLGNVGTYFECSDFATYGAPDTNLAWLTCCDGSSTTPQPACDVPCVPTTPCPQITENNLGDCIGATFASYVNGVWVDGGGLGSTNPNDSSIMDYFMVGNANLLIGSVTFELPRVSLTPGGFNLDCTGCNGFQNPINYDPGTSVIWRITGVSIERAGANGVPGGFNYWPTISSESWEVIRIYMNTNYSLGITPTMDYTAVLALPGIENIYFTATPCLGCS